jgi:hypothetical protein
MPRVEFEPTIAVFEWAKTVHTSDLSGTVIGYLQSNLYKIYIKIFGA